MVILKMLFSKSFGCQLFVVLKEFYKIGRVFKAETVGDLAYMVIRIKEEAACFAHDKLVYDLARAEEYCFAAGCVEILGGSVQLFCQHPDLPLYIRLGEQEVDETGVELCLYAGVKKSMAAFFK